MINYKIEIVLISYKTHKSVNLKKIYKNAVVTINSCESCKTIKKISCHKYNIYIHMLDCSQCLEVQA